MTTDTTGLSEHILRAAARIAEAAPRLTPVQRQALIVGLAQLAFAEGSVHAVSMIGAIPAASAAIDKARTL
jgi:acid stress-induced BolA-like protein IbaG/YrbA